MNESTNNALNKTKKDNEPSIEKIKKGKKSKKIITQLQ